MRVFRSNFGYVAGGLVGLLALVASVGCSGMTCEPVGCGREGVTLKGSLNFVTEPIVVDMTVCLDHECQSESFDLRTLDASTPCLTRSPGSEICLATGETNTFDLHFSGPINQSSSDRLRPSTIELKLVRHESGAVLLDEKRNPTFEHYEVGDCHYECWYGEATL